MKHVRTLIAAGAIAAAIAYPAIAIDISGAGILVLQGADSGSVGRGANQVWNRSGARFLDGD